MEVQRIKPDTEWMKEKYDEYNDKLFNGKLGDCIFRAIPLGERVLGRFQMTNGGLYYDKWTRRLYEFDKYTNVKTYVNVDNFFEVVLPMITLNTNYSATKDSWEDVLVHEMCHYYVSMFGLVPKQAHGVEFRRIAQTIGYKSNGRFSVQRLASAETMENMELDKSIQQKKEKRTINRINSVYVVLVYRKNGDIDMTITKNKELVDRIVKLALDEFNIARGGVLCCKVGKSPEISEILLKNQYTKTQNTYRYYPIKGEPILNELEKVKFEKTYYPNRKDNLDEEVTDVSNTIKINKNQNLGLSVPDEK